MRKILVLRGGALGDFLVTLPALALLRRRWPESRIELVGNPTAAELGLREGLIDAVHSQHQARWSELYGGPTVSTEMSDWLGGFDLVVNYWPDPDGTLGKFFPRRPGQVFLTGASQPRQVEPAAAHYAGLLRGLGIEMTRGDLFYRLQRLQSAPRKGEPRRIAIHPGSGSPRKNWPMERWGRLCEWLRKDARMELLIVAGAAEHAENSAEPLSSFGPIARDLPLEELAGRLAECRLFLGHDSGISHLAASCGVPCVLLFGPTDPAIWAPPAPHVQVVRAGTEMEATSLADVQRAVLATLEDQR